VAVEADVIYLDQEALEEQVEAVLELNLL